MLIEKLFFFFNFGFQVQNASILHRLPPPTPTAAWSSILATQSPSVNATGVPRLPPPASCLPPPAYRSVLTAAGSRLDVGRKRKRVGGSRQARRQAS